MLFVPLVFCTSEYAPLLVWICSGSYHITSWLNVDVFYFPPCFSLGWIDTVFISVFLAQYIAHYKHSTDVCQLEPVIILAHIYSPCLAECWALWTICIYLLLPTSVSKQNWQIYLFSVFAFFSFFNLEKFMLWVTPNKIICIIFLLIFLSLSSSSCSCCPCWHGT